MPVKSDKQMTGSLNQRREKKEKEKKEERDEEMEEVKQVEVVINNGGMMGTGNAIALIRVSSPRGQCLNMQRQIVEQYIESKGLTCVTTHEYRGSSYHTSYIKVIKQLALMLKSKNISHLVVHTADRLSRSMTAFTLLLNSVDKRIILHFIEEEITIPVSDFFPPTVKACEVYNAIIAAQTSSAVLSSKMKSHHRILSLTSSTRKVKIGDNNQHQTGGEKQNEEQELKHLICWLYHTKKFSSNIICNLLNNQNVYYTFILDKQQQYMAWTPQLLKDKKYLTFNSDDINVKVRPRSHLGFKTKVNHTTQIQQQNIINIRTIKGKKYCKVTRIDNKNQDHTFWIPSNQVSTIM